MKIAVDIRSLMDERYSGVSWYAFNLLKNLLAIDQKNEYLLFYNSHKKISLPEFRQDNVSYRGFKYPNKLFNLAVNFFGRPRLDRLVGGADVFLLPNLHFAAWSKDCRKALVVHDLSFVCFPEFFSRRMRLWQKLILRKRIIEQADILITDSQNTKKDLIRFFHLDQNKIQVVPLGIGEEYRPIDASDGRLLEIREKYDLPADFALYLGNLEPRKNIATIIEAVLAADPAINLVVAGGINWKTDNLRRLATGQKRVKLIGYVDEADKPALYNLAAMFIYPSYYEGFGLPVLEAMACGCPVIAAADSSLFEVIGAGGLLVNPYSRGEIITAILSLRNDSDFRTEMVTRGRQRAEQFSWRLTATKTLEVLENCFNQKR